MPAVFAISILLRNVLGAYTYTRGWLCKVQLQKKGTRRLIGSRRQPEDILLIKVWKSSGQFGTPARNILFRTGARALCSGREFYE